MIAEYVNGAAVASPTREYIYSGGALLAKIDSSGTKYYHQDHLSNRLVTDSSGNTVAQMGHYPFGESWYNATNDKLLFTSYERDAESGNDYAMARYHVNRLGRFSSPDAFSGNVADPQSLNRYPYTENNATDFIDPSGLIRTPWGYAGDDPGAGAGFGFDAYGSEFELLGMQVTGELYHSDISDFPFEKYTSDQLHSLAGDGVIEDLGQVTLSAGVLWSVNDLGGFTGGPLTPGGFKKTFYKKYQKILNDCIANVFGVHAPQVSPQTIDNSPVLNVSMSSDQLQGRCDYHGGVAEGCNSTSPAPNGTIFIASGVFNSGGANDAYVHELGNLLDAKIYPDSSSPFYL